MDTLRWLGSVFSEVVIVFCAEAQWGDGRQTFRVGCPAWVHWVHLKGRKLRRISKELRATNQKVGSSNLSGQRDRSLCGNSRCESRYFTDLSSENCCGANSRRVSDLFVL